MLTAVCISDTHAKHRQFADSVDIPHGDVLIHTGDFDGALNEFREVLSELAHPYKMFIPGNHDSVSEIQEFQDPSSNVFVLNHSSAEIAGIRFYGDPFCRPSKAGRFFQRLVQKVYLPNAVRACDVLMTHYPPVHVLDLAWDPHNPLSRLHCSHCDDTHESYRHWGSSSLRDEVQRVAPSFHVFGHVHDCPGTEVNGPTTFVNASSTCGSNFFEPQVFEIELPDPDTIPFRQLLCSNGRYLHHDASTSPDPSPHGWRLSIDPSNPFDPSGWALETSNGTFLRVHRNGMIDTTSNQGQGTKWKYMDDYLFGPGGHVLDVDKRCPEQVILWQPRNTKNQGWQFV